LDGAGEVGQGFVIAPSYPIAFASFFERDGEGALTEVGAIDQVSKVLGQVAVMDAIAQTPTLSTECRVICVTAGIGKELSPLPCSNSVVLRRLNS
jgi:hypothetical protein